MNSRTYTFHQEESPLNFGQNSGHQDTKSIDFYD
jgi:hypothetical protein